MERRLYVKLIDWMSNSVDPDETAHWAHLQKSIIIACGSERVKGTESHAEIFKNPKT